MEVLTHSMRSQFKNCRRYYYNRNVLGLRSIRDKPGRRRGSIFGDTLYLCQRIYYDHPEWLDETQADNGFRLIPFIDHYINKQYERIIDQGLYYGEEDAQEMEVEAVKMRVMVLAYIQRYGVDRRREIEFYLPLVNPKTGRSSRRWRLGGKIDGVIPLGDNRVRMVEDKLMGQIQKAMIDRLPLDEQIKEYAAAFAAKGYTADVYYRHTKWPGVNPMPAKQFKTKDDYPGETLDEFFYRLYEDVTVTRPDFYFDEQILMFPLEDLQEYAQERWDTAQDIMLAEKQKRWYRNPSRCWEWGGCEFIPLCAGWEEAMNLYTTETRNPELARA
jgi:PD-(D/E)XK nuclease superfamily